MKKSIPKLILILWASLLANCTGLRHHPQERYVLVATNVKLPYWQTVRAGFDRAAAQLKVKAEFVGPDSYDPQAQQQELRRVIKSKPAGILVSPGDPALMKSDIDEAIATGIPVVTIDSDAPGSKRLAFVGTNNHQAGVIGGRLAAQRLQGKGNVVVFSIPGQANLEERLRGYREAFAEHPLIKIIEVINIKGDPRISFDRTAEILEKGKIKPDGFLCLEASGGKGVAEVLDRRGIKDKVVIAMDTDTETLEWIEKGVILATIAQKPYTMAYYGLKLVDDLHHYQPKPLDANWVQEPFSLVPTLVDTGATLVNKTNLGAFTQPREFATTSVE